MAGVALLRVAKKHDFDFFLGSWTLARSGLKQDMMDSPRALVIQFDAPTRTTPLPAASQACYLESAVSHLESARAYA